MTEAIEQYTHALQGAKRTPETTAKERARIYQKLTQTSMNCSILAPKPKKQSAHAQAAQEYGRASLQAAKESGDECMAAQVEFLLACVAAWVAHLQRSGDKSGDEIAKVEGDMQNKLEKLKRYPELKMKVYEEQMRVYLGYLLGDSQT